MQRDSTPAVGPIPEPFWEDVLVSGLDPIALDRRAAQVFDNTASIDGSVALVAPSRKRNVMKMLVVTVIVGLLLGIPAKLTTMMTTTATGEWFDTSRDSRFWGR